jgi:hypothetical protein
MSKKWIGLLGALFALFIPAMPSRPIMDAALAKARVKNEPVRREWRD